MIYDHATQIHSSFQVPQENLGATRAQTVCTRRSLQLFEHLGMRLVCHKYKLPFCHSYHWRKCQYLTSVVLLKSAGTDFCNTYCCGDELLQVFLDEVNTSSCLGLFKEIIVDRTFDGNVCVIFFSCAWHCMLSTPPLLPVHCMLITPPLLPVHCMLITPLLFPVHPRECVCCGCVQPSPWKQPFLPQSKIYLGPRILLCPTTSPNSSLPDVGLWLSRQWPGESLHQCQDENAQQENAQCWGMRCRLWGCVRIFCIKKWPVCIHLLPYLYAGGKPNRPDSNQPEIDARLCLQPTSHKWDGWAPGEALIPQLCQPARHPACVYLLQVGEGFLQQVPTKWVTSRL